MLMTMIDVDDDDVDNGDVDKDVINIKGVCAHAQPRARARKRARNPLADRVKQ